mgnify:FL=1
MGHEAISIHMKELAAVRFVERKSKFYAHLYEVKSEVDIESILKRHRKDYKKAVHHCYGARIRENGNVREISKDDGEVGHPGKVLLDLLRHEELDSHVLMVSRIFGGRKLGVGGVSRAFNDAGKGVLDHYLKNVISTDS